MLPRSRRRKPFGSAEISKWIRLTASSAITRSLPSCDPARSTGCAFSYAERNAIEIPTVAHAGDGNTHPIIVFDAADASSTQRAHTAFDEIMSLAISLGGTITGEHGVGRLKKNHLPAQLGPNVMALTHRIKNALDPLGILNPGAVL